MQSQKQKIIKTYQKKDNVELFDEKRDKYLFQKHKHKTEADFLKKTLREIKRGKIKILDVGCGTGRMLAEVFSIGKDIEYVGLDTSNLMTKHLKEKAKRLGVEKKIKVRIGNATRIPFKGEEFNVVFSYHLLWHIPIEDQEKIIKEMKRVCKKGGFIIFDILNKDFVWERLKWILKKEKLEELYKLNLKDAKEIAGEVKEIEIRKLSDAQIKNSSLYKMFNLINKSEKVLPKSFYHMIYLKIKK